MILFVVLISGCAVNQHKPIVVLESKLYPQKFEEIWSQVVNSSVANLENTEEAKFKCFLDTLSGGLSQCLNDPYAKYLTPLEWKEYQDSSDPSYEGVGLVLDQYRNRVVVQSSMRGTPAGNSRAFMPGDVIDKIEGQDVSKESLSKIVDLIAGPDGTFVAIQVMRRGKLMPPVKLKRAEIVIQEVESVAITKDITYIKINEFHYKFFQQFFDAFAAAVADSSGEILNTTHSRSVIIDLRDNLGGFLASVKFASYLFSNKPDDVVITLKEKNGEKKVYLKDIKKQIQVINPAFDIPPGVFAETRIIILVNGSTASSSEILAGLMRDWLGAPLLGEITYGKGSVQGVHELNDQDGVKFTEAEYLVGNSMIKVNQIGLVPDFLVTNPLPDDGSQSEVTPSLIDLQNDHQLRKAIEILRNSQNSLK